MVLYHRIKFENAQAILKEGFRDHTDYYCTQSLHTGVWLSNVPLDENEGAVADTLLKVSLHLPDAELEGFEWVEEGKPHPEWLVGAAFVNLHVTVRVVERPKLSQAVLMGLS